jgi:hypothetical protein
MTTPLRPEGIPDPDDPATEPVPITPDDLDRATEDAKRWLPREWRDMPDAEEWPGG